VPARWLAAHPIGGFVALVFFVSYLTGVPALISAQWLISPDAPLLRSYGSRALVVYGPALAALGMAAIRRQDGGAAALAGELIPRGNALLLAVAIAVAGAAVGGAALLASGIAGSDLLAAFRGHPGLVAAHWLLQIGVVAIGEELGWRGWLLPELGARTTRLRATLGTAAIWTLWHGPLLFRDALTVTAFVLGTFGLSVLFAWLRWRASTGLFAVVIAHASVNAPFFFWEQVSPETASSRTATAWVLAEAIYFLAAAVLLLATWQWWMQHPASTAAKKPNQACRSA
jgi:membrane protease YdiL (CAAX protease family)